MSNQQMADETREVRQMMSDIIYKSLAGWGEEYEQIRQDDWRKQKKSKEKIELAQRTIQDMISNKERISVPKLMKKTGLSRGFFYKNPIVRDTMNEAIEQQAGMIDPRREILNMAMEKQIELLNQKVTALTRENRELKKANEKLQKALRKQDLNFIKNL